jgi:hypothetical protein
MIDGIERRKNKMNEEVNLWDEIIDDELHKQIYNVGFQKGKLEQKKEELEFLIDLNKKIHFERFNNYSKNDVDFILIHNRIKQLQKEIGGKEEKEGEDEHRI